MIGTTGSGKSSLINVLCGEREALMSDSALGCTHAPTTYHTRRKDQLYEFIDTVGLNEHSGGYKKATDALADLLLYITQDEIGYNAILFVQRRGRIDKWFDLHHRIFMKCFTKHQIPSILVMSGYEGQTSPIPDEDDVKKALKEYHFDAIVFGTTFFGGVFEEHLKKMRKDTAEEVWKLIESKSREQPEKIVKNIDDGNKAKSAISGLLSSVLGNSQ